MSRDYHTSPSALLYPTYSDQFRLFVDTKTHEIGYEFDVEKEQSKMEHDINVLKALLGVR